MEVKDSTPTDHKQDETTTWKWQENSQQPWNSPFTLIRTDQKANNIRATDYNRSQVISVK